jgi:hypothetical protein
MTISAKDSPPSPPIVDDEHTIILNHQLELFGQGPDYSPSLPDSTIINDAINCNMLHIPQKNCIFIYFTLEPHHQYLLPDP